MACYVGKFELMALKVLYSGEGFDQTRILSDLRMVFALVSLALVCNSCFGL